MNTWLITDTHFGHKRLIEYGRPVDFEERLWKSLFVIKPGDTLIHLGDVAMHREGENHTNFIKALPGVTTMLLLGNHDTRSTKWYLDKGWGIVGTSFKMKLEGKTILFSHTPTQPSGGNVFDLNIHGHLHGNDHREDEYPWMNDKHKQLAMEWVGYRPVLLNEFIESE